MPEVTDPALLEQLNAGRRTARPVAILPSPQQDADNTRADAGAQNDQVRTGIAVREEDRTIDDRAFKKERDLATEYSRNPEVAAYRATMPNIASALRAPKNGQGDLSIIYAYAKVMDPGSVVRESEMEMASSTSPWAQAKVQELRNQLDGSGRLPPATRAGLEQEMIRKGQALRKSYDGERARYMADAQAYGLDPMRVVGAHHGEAFRDTMQAYDKERGIGRFAPDNTISPEMRGGLPKGTQITFGGGDGGFFDRAAYVQDKYGVTPDQEDWITAFWNGNRGNPNLTPEGVKQAYTQAGIAPPPDASILQGIDYAAKGYAFSAFDTTQAEEDYKNRLNEVNTGRMDNAGAAARDPNSVEGYIQRFQTGVPLGLADEAAGVGGFIGNLITGQNPTEGYIEARDADRLLQEQMREQQGVAGYATEFAGSIPSAVAIPTGPGRLLGELGGSGMVGQAIRGGVRGGTVSGFGQGEGFVDSTVGAGVGGVVGGTLGGALGGAGNLLTRRGVAPVRAPSEGREVISAADRLNTRFGTQIEPMPADVSGPAVRRATGGAAQFPLSASPIIRQGQAVTGETQAARDAIARMAGNALDPEQAGEAAVNGAIRYMKNSKTKVDALYTKARAKGGNQPVDLVNARSTLDEHIAELAQTPGGAKGLDRMQALRAELDQPFPVEGVRRMRTNLRDDFATDGLRGGDLERRMMQVADAADDDIVDALVQSGRTDAAKLYREAANAHRERVTLIDDVLVPFIGKDGDKSGEAVFAAIESATKSKNAALNKFLDALPPEDSSTVRASLIGRLGRSGAGTQNAEGNAFSSAEFLTHWNKMTPGAKSTLFGGELRAALDDLARVAGGSKQAQRYANHSNTGSTLGLLATGANGGAVFTAPISSTLALLAQYGGGRLLASPKFARWLAKMPAEQGKARLHLNGLRKIAVVEPALKADLSRLYDRLNMGVPSYAGADPQGADQSKDSRPTIEVPR